MGLASLYAAVQSQRGQAAEDDRRAHVAVRIDDRVLVPVALRHRGGGGRRIYRRIDFARNKDGMPGTVKAIEYDPNRTCHIALIEYSDGEKRYILAPAGLTAGDVVESGPRVEPKVGNVMPLMNMPPGMD
ncbi:MAG: hypothetical protein IH861_14975, partial [Chloroflexi bacterium]|nr:hypothetical protein [Chloroflexota bacterium]